MGNDDMGSARISATQCIICECMASGLDLFLKYYQFQKGILFFAVHLESRRQWVTLVLDECQILMLVGTFVFHSRLGKGSSSLRTG